MTKEKSTVPRLRFPGFTDAWKQRKLGEVADFSIKTNSLSRDKLSSYFYEVQNIHYGDILTKYDAILDVCNKELPSIIGSTISDFADDLLIEGDIVFADAAEDSTVGKAIEVRNFKGKNVVSGLHTIVARPKVSYAPYYLGYLINSTAYHNQILPLMQGTKVSSISKANLKSTTIVFPTLPEQEAIGSFFSDLDQLITLHQRKLDDVKELKKALLQKMFPKGNGNDFPELRFPEFKDAWKQRKLREVATFVKGNGYSKKDLVIEGSPIILYGRLYTKYETVISEVDTFVSVEDNKNSVVYSEGGEVLVPASGESSLDIARASVVAKKGIILGGDINIIRLHSEIFPVFLALTISNGKQQKGLSKRAQGKSVVHLHNSDLKKVDLDFPTLPEQEAIGSFFSDLDQLITLHQRQLDHLKLLKKALLQQMFI
ncbi:TPA: restriction endonuclease subunit S [Streptococcus suis]|uniref:restriction endonuclease subunit S n=1 Tax=Streptococcus suis TaxID=1307 RepID=UPI001553306D|nr:restriction endonuclease subunit S [Streptococcus suis]MDW8720802.1 restriction endonuclease subunit S [Streptococcus suis]NQR54138.1 restriction endonuclease subunit S [Streptococcus suis]HEL1588613.1 restriction endonuclease subunit S [Streptococcus suis]HEL1691969.1 restriction endonuclease subunit S [Streptococcus suis]HEL1776735.1 restriction endonuclease subunit S [Streptococcus suis]